MEFQEKKSLKWKKIHIRQGTLVLKQGSLHYKSIAIKFTGVEGQRGEVPDVGFQEKPLRQEMRFCRQGTCFFD